MKLSLPPPVMEKSRFVNGGLITAITLALLHGALHPASAAPLFGAPFISFDAGASQFAAIGDLNGDGKPDMAVVGANYLGTVSVLLGTGGGSFGAKTEYTTGGNPFCVAIGDLNGDGKPDLAVGNGDATVSVLLGNGDGSFGAKIDYVTASYPRSVAIGDFNGDGKPDLATANSNSNSVSVLLGNGDGSFGVKTDFGTGSGPVSVAIGDLNGDSKPDLAVVNNSSDGTVSVLLGNGDGSFGVNTDYDTGVLPYSVAIGDLNGDGKLDLAVANNNSYTVSVLLGNGDGSFGVKTDFGTGSDPVSVAIADLNADGKPDLATANRDGNTVSVMFGNGDGSFAAKNDFPTGAQPSSVAIADLSGDGKPDLATADMYAKTVSVLLGNGDGSFGVNSTFDTGDAPSSVAIGDLNADSKPDLAVASYQFFSVSVLLGNGDGSFGVKTDFGTGSDPTSVAIGDLNGDGKPDLAVAGEGFGTVSVLLGNGDGSFGAKTDYAVGGSAQSVAIGDLNGDGKPDLATANPASYPDFVNSVSVLLGNGDGSFGEKTDFGTAARPFSVAIGDLNADGKPDLATANDGSYPDYLGSVSVLLGNGDGSFGVNTEFGTGGGAVSVAIGDLNGDGKPDLATANSTSNTASVLLGHGDGSFAAKTDYSTGIEPRSVAISDLDGDGKSDVATANRGSYTASVLLGSGDGTIGVRIDYGAERSPSSVAIGDLNGDGKPDLVTANGYNSNTVSVLLNISAPSHPSAPMTFDLSPSTLDLHSKGRWVTATLEPEPPALPGDIDIASILLNGSVPVDGSAPTSIGDEDRDGRPDLTVKFDRVALELAVEEGDAVTVTISGKIGSGSFEATDVIRVKRGHISAPGAGAVLQSGSTTELRWDTPADIDASLVGVLFSADGGATWKLVARDLPNTGSYLWAVPDIRTDHALVAVALVGSDPSGTELDGVLGLSAGFAITSVTGVGSENVSFALRGAIPNPSRGLNVSFTLVNAEPARLAVYDVTGRRVMTRQVGSLGAGRHVVSLGAPGTLAPGIYLVHLAQGSRKLVARAVVVQ